ncbi:hypothetical protein EKE94_08675 [Mesobaculum littorinae]|uniref:Uncharacterized protein n=1 Tax=Mesobaculum littorinae TaxID=2486419 RepID=A0A438AJY1_9RHOB|nr:hypothetical protein [Mesobaculum littorinae]RVV98946.1 hypothetical protein EKE94_08675 [Mesobaculum littorinae]
MDADRLARVLARVNSYAWRSGNRVLLSHVRVTARTAQEQLGQDSNGGIDRLCVPSPAPAISCRRASQG